MVNFKKPVTVASLIVDEPWKPWSNRKQTITLQYMEGKIWKNVLTMTTNGVGDKQQFRPVTSSQFRLLIQNKDEAPTLLEWQMYGAE